MLTLRWDIALLRLSSDAILNNYVQLGALPPSGQVLPHNNPCYISGWGRTQSESKELKQLDDDFYFFFIHGSDTLAHVYVFSSFLSWRSAVCSAEAGQHARCRPQHLHQLRMVGQHCEGIHGLCRWLQRIWLPGEPTE